MPHVNTIQSVVGRRTPEVRFLDRKSEKRIAIYWSDPLSCRYMEQIWRLANANATGVCAVSGTQIHPGEPVYRPAYAEPRPRNHEAMIAEQALHDIESAT